MNAVEQQNAAQARADEHAEMAAERYELCRQAAARGDRRQQHGYLFEADRQTERAEQWAAAAIRHRIDVRAEQLQG